MFEAIKAALSLVSSTIQVVRLVLPDIIALAGDIDKALPAGTPLEQKVAHVKDILGTALVDVQGLPVSAGDIIPALVAVAERHLNFLNTVVPAAAPADGATA